MLPVQHDAALLREIELTPAPGVVLWWLGHAGFVLKHRRIVLYVDPYLSNSQAERYRHSDDPHRRLVASPLDPRSIRHADLLLATHAHGAHLDWGTAQYLLEASPGAKLVLPRGAAGRAHALGVDYLRMLSTDGDLKIDYGKDGDQCQIIAVPSAHEQLDWTREGGYPYLGYVIRCGAFTIYHAGDGVPYEGLVEKLRPWRVTVALLPVSGRDPRRGKPGNFTPAEAASLARDIGAGWLVPMHYGMFDAHGGDASPLVDHVLGHHPSLRLKVFQCGERWVAPAPE
jgi:L-ascorbate metabolism protein UlaG (beta-lactamase superfamily)